MPKSSSQQTATQIEELFNKGAHLGHKKSRLHPKAGPYVYKILNGIAIIDLTKTVEMLHNAEEFLKKHGQEGKSILVVATKRIGAHTTAELCKKHGIGYITSKWLPGLITNYETIIKNVQHLRTLKQQKESGELKQFVKHEQIKIHKKIARLEKFYGGIENMTGIPEVLLVLDIKRENNAIAEAHKKKIPVVGVVDTNANPETIDYPVLVNDDAEEVVTYMMTRLVEAYTNAYKAPSTTTPTEEKEVPSKIEEKPKKEKGSKGKEEEKKTEKTAESKKQKEENKPAEEKKKTKESIKDTKKKKPTKK